MPGSSASTSVWLKTRRVPRLTPRLGLPSPAPTLPPSSQAAASRTRASSNANHLEPRAITRDAHARRPSSLERSRLQLRYLTEAPWVIIVWDPTIETLKNRVTVVFTECVGQGPKQT